MNEKIKKETIRRIISWADGKPQPPIRIDLEPTFSCNLKCKFCWQRSKERLKQCDYSRPLSENRILEIIGEAAELGVLEWQIAGGWEPMIKPKFCMRIMKRIKEHKMYGCLTTNGTLFGKEDIQELVEIGWDQILFSLEGADHKTHDSITGIEGSFDRSTKAIALFRKYKQKLKTEQPVYSFHTVLTSRNYNQLSKMITWGHKLGTCGVCFEPLNVWSEEGDQLKLDEPQTKEFQRLIPFALRISKKLNIPTNLKSLQEVRLIEKKNIDKVIESDLTEFSKEKRKYPLLAASCFNPWLNLEIRISGHVVPCRLCDTHQYASKLHNKKLKDVWFGDYFDRIRNEVFNNNLPRYCKTCASGVIVDFRMLRKEIKKSNSVFSKMLDIVK